MPAPIQYISTNGTDWTTFATAGIVDCILTLRATGTDELRLVIDPTTWTQAATYATGDTLYFKQDTTVFFVGRVAELPREATGPQHRLSYTLLGPWHRFEKITYGQDWTLRRSSDNAEVTLSKPRVVLGQNSAGAAITNGAQIAAVIDFLITRGVPILKGTIDAGIQMPYDEQKMLNCADAIRTCLRWSPDWVAWFDYTTLDSGIPKPTFNCRARANLTAATLNLTSTTKPEEAALRPRADLVIPGIRIVYEKAHTYDSNTWNSYELDTAGDDANAECVDLLFELQGSVITLNKQTLEVANYPDPDIAAEVKAFFRLHIPWLADIEDADLLIENVTTDGTEGYTKYITEGAVPDWLLDQVGVEEETITATCSFIRRDADDNPLEDVEAKEISVKLLSTDGATREYQSIGSIDYGETTPTGVAAAIYASWSVLHYEGQFSIIQAAPDFSFIPGKTLNITNGLAAWSTMAAVIQDATISFADGITTIRIGPPARLDADTLVALYRATHARSFSWSRLQRTSSALAGTETTGPKNLPRERPNDGDPGKKNRLQVRNEDGDANEHVLDLDPASTTFADAGDKAAVTLAPREILVPEVVSGAYVMKRRQVLCSPSYHDPVDLLTAIPSHPFRFTQSGDTGGTVEWGSVAIDGVLKTVADWTNHGTGEDLTLSGVTTTTRYYIEIDHTAKTATWKSTASAFPDGDADTDIWPILTLVCAGSVITAVKRHQWSDMHARSSGSSGNNHAFKFSQTSGTGGNLESGALYLAGVSKTITSLPSTLSSVTSTTRYYIEVEIAAATAEWKSTTGSFPTSDSDTEIWPILTLTCTDSIITAIKQHQCSDIHIPSNA